MFLRGSTSYVVRDITDINHPFTVSSLGGLAPVSGPHEAYSAQFVGPNDISYYDGTGHFLRQPFNGPAVTIAGFPTGISGFTWSADGRTAAYLTNTTTNTGQLRLVTGGEDCVAATLPWFMPAGCETPTSCDRFNMRLLYSPNGAYLSLVNGWPGPQFRVWTSAGKELASKDSSFNTWSVWSGDTLYFRTDQGIETWRSGQLKLLLPQVAWVDSEASPSGGQIVYQTRDASGTAHVELFDTFTGKVREIKSSRAYPAFLTGRYIWYAGERPCTASDHYPCPYSITTATGVTYIYDMLTGTESTSIITEVFDVWPHPA